MEAYQGLLTAGLVMLGITSAKLINGEENWIGYSFSTFSFFLSGILVSFMP